MAEPLVAIRRDPSSQEVRAHGGNSEVHSILQRAGFVPVVRLRKTHHRAPAALTAAEETHLATKAVLRLRGAGYEVECDAEFHTVPHTHHHLPLGAQVAQRHPPP